MMVNNQPRRFPLSSSKLKLERKLNRTRAPDLVQRIKAAVLAAAAEVVVQHLCGLAELGCAEVIDRVAEVRVIQNVEDIASRLQRKTFCKAKLPTQRQVPLRRTESTQGIASQIPLPGDRYRCGECRCVDHLASRRALWVKVKRHAGNDIRPVAAVGP